METAPGGLAAELVYTDGEDGDQRRMNLTDPDQWGNFTDNLLEGYCYYIFIIS